MVNEIDKKLNGISERLFNIYNRKVIEVDDGDDIFIMFKNKKTQARIEEIYACEIGRIPARYTKKEKEKHFEKGKIAKNILERKLLNKFIKFEFLRKDRNRIRIKIKNFNIEKFNNELKKYKCYGGYGKIFKGDFKI